MMSKSNRKKQSRDDLDRNSPADALAYYMKEISKIKPLTRSEERALSLQIVKGDIVALQQLVQKNLKYVVSVANKYRGHGLSFQDLIEEGNIGLIQAAKRFDASYKVKFITYATWWIKQAIILSLAEQARVVKLPVKQAAKMHKRTKSFNHLAQTFSREPTQAEEAQHQKIPVKDYEIIMRSYQKHFSLNTPCHARENTTYLELLEMHDAVPYDEQIMSQELNAKIDELIMGLPEREKNILKMRFGFDGEAKTLEEIGCQFGLSRERVRQIEKRAKKQLQTNQSLELF